MPSTGFALALALTGCGDDGAVVDDDTDTSTGTDTGGDDVVSPTMPTTIGTGASESDGDGTDTGTAGADDSTSGVGTDDDAGSTDGAESSDERGDESGGVFVCDPIDLGSATGEVYAGSTEGAGDDLLTSCALYGAPELELQWTAPSAASWQIDTLGSSFDTVLQVVRDDCEGEELACNDDFSGLQSGMLVELFAGDTIVVLVDGFGGAAGDFVLNIDVGAPGDCCEVGFFGGCEVAACEASVCAIDPTCCNEVWDSTCAQTWAPLVCPDCAPPGSCCAPQSEPGCNDESCADDVCAIDPSCCDTQWTAACATLAATHCSICIPENCCEPHDNPGCGTPTCEAIVCNQWDEWCCMVQWDEWCAQLANDNCPTCQEPGPCCWANPGVGCDEPAVETCVCATLPQCCTGQWTGACVDAVSDLGCGTCDPLDLSCVDFDLGTATGEVATGTNVGAGDDTTIACTAVGGQEYVFAWEAPSTGTWVFDTVGSDYDTALGVRFPDCPGDLLGCTGNLGDTESEVVLDLVEGQPVVIIVDGFGAATGNYVLNINPPPGYGFCCAANGSPGCSSASCEAAVCATDPSCCTTDWSAACAATALTECAVCQTLGDCCEAHLSPGCADLTCAATVCAMDPWCCDTEWSDGCVDEADSWCAAGC